MDQELTKCSGHDLDMLTGYCLKCGLKMFETQQQRKRREWIEQYLATKAVDPGREEYREYLGAGS